MPSLQREPAGVLRGMLVLVRVRPAAVALRGGMPFVRATIAFRCRMRLAFATIALRRRMGLAFATIALRGRVGNVGAAAIALRRRMGFGLDLVIVRMPFVRPIAVGMLDFAAEKSGEGGCWQLRFPLALILHRASFHGTNSVLQHDEHSRVNRCYQFPSRAREQAVAPPSDRNTKTRPARCK